MVQVNLRHMDDLTGHELGRFPPSELGALVEAAKRHDAYIDEGDPGTYVDAQFVATEADGVFFEIIFGDSE